MKTTRPAARRPQPPRIRQETGFDLRYCHPSPHRFPLLAASGGGVSGRRRDSHLDYIAVQVDLF